MLNHSALTPKKPKLGSSFAALGFYILAGSPLLGLVSTEAQANLAAPYQYVGDWNTVKTPVGSNAFIQTDIPNVLRINGANEDNFPDPTTGDISITRTVLADGIWSFNWYYEGQNPEVDARDVAYYSINGQLFELASSFIRPYPSGLKSIPITAGDLIGFKLEANSGYVNFLDITNFTISTNSNVPEPGTLALFSAGLGIFLRKKATLPA